ncbi:MAG: helix-turn-helix domain-containing protein [Thauera sp.]|jgi:putative transcriptional regulator|nr:helix-turn-helix domain-containing protein [Thauera sp.]
MNEKSFEELLDSVRDMGRHMRGEDVVGLRAQEFPEPDVRAIRERTGLSQSRFAYLIGVKPKTLQNWEQRRVRPAGPARALLKIVDANPDALLAIHS